MDKKVSARFVPLLGVQSTFFARALRNTEFRAGWDYPLNEPGVHKRPNKTREKKAISDGSGRQSQKTKA